MQYGASPGSEDDDNELIELDTHHVQAEKKHFNFNDRNAALESTTMALATPTSPTIIQSAWQSATQYIAEEVWHVDPHSANVSPADHPAEHTENMVAHELITYLANQKEQHNEDEF